MKISIIGSGYVGLTTGACFAKLGNEVTCIDNNEEKVKTLLRGEVHFYEPGLADLVRSNTGEGRLHFTTSIKEGVKDSKAIFLCVGTPTLPNNMADVTDLLRVGTEAAQSLTDYAVIVEKSTVPAGTAGAMRKLMEDASDKSKFDVAVNPEFLREGSAIRDFLKPDRIVIGSESARANAVLTELYGKLNAPLLFMNLAAAELTKHAANAMLSMRISYANSISQVCERVGADVSQVMKGVGLDKRIGEDFLQAGIGFGGFCFPKDLSALIGLYKSVGADPSLFESVERINAHQRQHFVNKTVSTMGGLAGKTIAALGLAFKPNTDDMRLAPSIDIIRSLQHNGATVRAYDPKAMDNAKQVLPSVVYCKDAWAALAGADAMLLLTEWPEFCNLDMGRVKSLLRAPPIVLDGRNVYDPDIMRGMGFTYASIGR